MSYLMLSIIYTRYNGKLMASEICYYWNITGDTLYISVISSALSSTKYVIIFETTESWNAAALC